MPRALLIPEERADPLDGTKLEETPDGADVAIRQTLAHSGTFAWLGAGALPDGGPAALLRY